MFKWNFILRLIKWFLSCCNALFPCVCVFHVLDWKFLKAGFSFFPFVFVTIFIMVKPKQIFGCYSVLIQTKKKSLQNIVFHNFTWHQLWKLPWPIKWNRVLYFFLFIHVDQVSEIYLWTMIKEISTYCF